ncbi:UbiA prenyltransferase family protein [Agromyces humi]|uniref:hypothetical protein n=1 Tax=Agromyces humi TaxID=1766800 RepID=UPI002E26F244
MMKTETVQPGPLHTVAQVLLSSRPISWINTAFPFAAAYLLTAGTVDALFVVGTLFFLVPYNLVMYGVNDVFDYESDLRNPRKGGSEGALLEPRLHRLVVWAGVVTATPLLVAMSALAALASARAASTSALAALAPSRTWL